MSGDDDGWEREFGDAPETEIDRPAPGEVAAEDAAPRAIRDETTGSYKTLQGYEVARETLERMLTVKGRTTERSFLLAALRFFLIDRGSHPDAADNFVAQFHHWVRDARNRRLVEKVLGWDKNPP